MRAMTLVVTTLTAALAFGFAWGLVSTDATANTTPADPPAPAKAAATGAIGCADARSVMQAYLYRDSTLEAMTAALDASDDRWQKANDAFLKAQREAFSSGEDGPSEDQWKAVEVARLGLLEVHQAISESFDKVLSERARSAQRDVSAAIERVAQARGCSAVHQRSALWGRELPDDEYTDTFEESSLLWAEGLIELNDDLLKDLGLPRDALEPKSPQADRVEALFARFQLMTTVQPPELPEHDDDAPADPDM
ncbi:MAG: hypothetical protein FJ270_04435 [Planctomycetes bacterium]|nr:hypothetical protein [Planctomycetota bacterium]